MGAGASAEAYVAGEEPVAQEGYDSDIAAEKGEAYERKTRPADGPPSKVATGGFVYNSPARGAIFGPSGWETRDDVMEPPANSLKLEFVHGYRAHDARHNIFYDKSGRVVYHAAGVCVAMDTKSRDQAFFMGHTDDILCLSQSPVDANVFASGQCGKNPKLCVWDSATMTAKWERELFPEGTNLRAIVSVSFSADGKKVAIVGLDEDHTVAVFDADTGATIAQSKGDKQRIYYAEFNPFSNQLVTCGDKHLAFWTLEAGYLNKEKATFLTCKGASVSSCLCAAFTPDGNTLVGTQTGTIYKFQGNKCIKMYPNAHQGPIHDLQCYQGDYIISSGKDGKVVFYDAYMTVKFVVDVSNVAEFNIDAENNSKSFFSGKAPCIKAINYDRTQGKMLIGTKSSEIYELDMSDEAAFKAGEVDLSEVTRTLMSGHAASYDTKKRSWCGEVWGLATHPSADVYMTVSDDATLRVWNLKDRTLKTMRKLTERARSVDISPDGRWIAVGTFYGQCVLYNAVTGKRKGVFKKAVRNSLRNEISVLKFSPNGRLLAIGSHGRGMISIYNVEANFKYLGTCEGHSASILGMDWSEDGRILQSTDAAYEILFWDITGDDDDDSDDDDLPKQIKSPSKICDTEWATYTCKVGWATQGIWPAFADGSDVNDVARSNRGTWWEGEMVLATADDYGAVNLYNYPSDCSRAAAKSYSGHSSHVTNVCFTANDKHLISTGGADRCVFQWRHYDDGEEEEDEDDIAEAKREAYLKSKSDRSSTSKSVSMVRTGTENGKPTYAVDTEGAFKANPRQNHSLRELGAAKGVTSPMTGRPCLGQIFPPSNMEEVLKGEQVYSAPAEKLEREWAFGFNGESTFNAVSYCGDSKIAYPLGAMGVVYDIEAHAQISVTDDPMGDAVEGNTDDIVSFAKHPTANIIATGEVGRYPKICIWDADTGKLLNSIVGYFRRAVVSLTFSPDGKYLAGVGLDDDHSIAVYDWDDEMLLAEAKGDKLRISNIEFNDFADGGKFQLCTTGDKHIKFWELAGYPNVSKGASLNSVKGQVSKLGKVQRMYGVSFPEAGKTLVGAKSGDLYLFNDAVLEKVIPAHKGLVNCSAIGGDKVYTAGSDGVVKVWKKADMTPDGEIEVPHPLADMGWKTVIKSLATNAEGNKLLIGTTDSTIFESVDGKAPKAIVEGHGEGEVWGNAAHPDGKTHVTCSDDGTIRVWDMEARKLLTTKAIVPKGEWEECWEIFHTGCVRSVSFNNKGDQLAVGMLNGNVHLYSFPALDHIKTLNDERSSRKEWVSAMKWSPDDKFFAVGTHDNFVDVYDVLVDYKLVGICKGHSSFINDLNWSKNRYEIDTSAYRRAKKESKSARSLSVRPQTSGGSTGISEKADGSYLLCTGSGDYELLFWEFNMESSKKNKCKQIRYSSLCANVEWFTWQSVIGWGSLCVFPAGSDGTDVNACDRNPAQTCLATGTDFGDVSLFRYPALGGPATLYGGHSSHVTNVRFNPAGEVLVSTGGLDKAVVKWAVKA